MLSMGGWIPILTLLAIYMREHLGASVIAAMTTILIIQVISTGMSLFAGSFADRWGGRRTYLVGVAGMTLFAGLLGAVKESWQVIALAPLAGLVVPFYWTGVSTYLLQAVSPRRRGAGAGTLSFITFLAPGITGPILTFFGQSIGIWFTVLGGAFLLALAGLTAARLLPDLTKANARPTGGTQFAYSDYPRFLADRHNLVAALARLMSGASFGLFQLLSALVLLDLTGELSSVGLFLTAGALGGGASQILIGALSDRIGRRNLLIATKLVGATAALLFWRGDVLPALLLGSAMQFFAQAAFQTLITAVAGDLVKPRDIPAISGLHTSMFAFGMVIGALTGGLVWQVDGRLPFLFIGLGFLPVAASLFVLPRKTLNV